MYYPVSLNKYQTDAGARPSFLLIQFILRPKLFPIKVYSARENNPYEFLQILDPERTTKTYEFRIIHYGFTSPSFSICASRSYGLERHIIFRLYKTFCAHKRNFYVSGFNRGRGDMRFMRVNMLVFGFYCFVRKCQAVCLRT